MANTARGEAECYICQETPPLMLCFIVKHEYTVPLLICWFCVGGLSVFSVVSMKALDKVDCYDACF